MPLQYPIISTGSAGLVTVSAAADGMPPAARVVAEFIAAWGPGAPAPAGVPAALHQSGAALAAQPMLSIDDYLAGQRTGTG